MDSPRIDFDTLAVGDRWRSHGRTLTEAELVQSCMSSGDWHPIHADETFAAGTPVGRRMFQGTYGVHVAVGMATPFPPLADDVIAALGLADWRYESPLLVGDTVHVDVEIVSKRRTSDGRRGVIDKRVRLVRQDGTVVQQGVVRSMVRVPPHADTGSRT